ncbi:hypothetical protein AB1Y20_022826 [Prymnesium parvum]|uniref:RNA helicase n=1 Tax=Prymnesium parvum TaxID=97485 RepID=A0AB34JC04_PRYPA
MAAACFLSLLPAFPRLAAPLPASLSPAAVCSPFPRRAVYMCVDAAPTEGRRHTFGPLAISEAMQARLHAAGYTHPMEIQREAMPLIAEGRNVVLHAATGSGKTLAFLAPLLAQPFEGRGVRVLIVSPSQELAIQLAADAQPLLAEDAQLLLAISTNEAGEREQEEALLRPAVAPRVIVGTPQRLVDLLISPKARHLVGGIQAVVLDEVDLLLPPSPTRDDQPPRFSRGEPSRSRGRGEPSRGRGARMGRGGGERRGAAQYIGGSIERRLQSKRTTEYLLESLLRNRRPGKPPPQLVSCSATITADLRRRIGALIGGDGKKGAGVVVTAAPAHPSPARLKKYGVGAVQIPSTISHSAYVGLPSGELSMLKVVFEEHAPEAPLLVLPNGRSVSKMVAALRDAGFDGAIPLVEALGVPLHSDGGGGGGGSQAAMLQGRAALQRAFATREAVPLLVTTEHSARGVDLKGVDVVVLLGVPRHLEAYVHLAGRTAREGRRGRAVSVVTSDEEQLRLDTFRRELGITIESVELKFL